MLCSDNVFYQSEKYHYFNNEDDCKVSHILKNHPSVCKIVPRLTVFSIVKVAVFLMSTGTLRMIMALLFVQVCRRLLKIGRASLAQLFKIKLD